MQLTVGHGVFEGGPCGAQITLEELTVISKLPHYCPVCAYHDWNLDGLVEMIWEYLDLLRIYTKPKARPRVHVVVGRAARLSMQAVERKPEQKCSIDSPSKFPCHCMRGDLSGPGAALAQKGSICCIIRGN